MVGNVPDTHSRKKYICIAPVIVDLSNCLFSNSKFAVNLFWQSLHLNVWDVAVLGLSHPPFLDVARIAEFAYLQLGSFQNLEGLVGITPLLLDEF